MTPYSSTDGIDNNAVLYTFYYGMNTSDYVNSDSCSLNGGILSGVPVINLKPEVTFSGTGTTDDPYTIN